MAKCQALADWEGYAARRAATEAAGRCRGRAIVYYVDNTGIFNERMELRFDPSGELTIIAGTLSHGQGHETSYAQMVADWLGVPEDKIRLAQADTDEVAIGRGTYGSRSMMIGGSALRAAADEVIAKGKRFAAHFLEADAADITFDVGPNGGNFTIAGTDRAMPIAQVAQMSFIPIGVPAELGVGLQGAGAAPGDVPSFPNGCHICEVELDPETGAVTLDRYAVVDDIGMVVNPLLARGQIHGRRRPGGRPGARRGRRLRHRERPARDRVADGLRAASRRHDPAGRGRFQPGAEPVEPARRQGRRRGRHGRRDAGRDERDPRCAGEPFGVADVAMPATPERIWRAIRVAQAAST